MTLSADHVVSPESALGRLSLTIPAPSRHRRPPTYLDRPTPDCRVTVTGH
jgi:hypothetical protein